MSKSPNPGRDAGESTSAASPPPHAVLRYTTLRLAVFFAVFVLLLLGRKAGILPNGGSSGVFFVLVISVLASGVLSYLVLNRQRDAMSAAIVGRVQRAKQNFAESRSGEDEEGESAEEEAGVEDLAPESASDAAAPKSGAER